MGFAIVTADGRYHGHVEDKVAAKEATKDKIKDPLLLTEEQWQQVIAGGVDNRASLCSELGVKL